MRRVTCTKKYVDFPFAHRQPNHDGHCSLIHGHSWGFDFTFEATQLDECGFVIDFGKLKWLKDFLTKMFDHTLVLNETDPWLEHLKKSLTDVTTEVCQGNSVYLADIHTVPDCSSEGLAQWLVDVVGKMLYQETKGRVLLVSVTVHEDSKNFATVIR